MNAKFLIAMDFGMCNIYHSQDTSYFSFTKDKKLLQKFSKMMPHINFVRIAPDMQQKNVGIFYEKYFSDSFSHYFTFLMNVRNEIKIHAFKG